MFAITVYFAVAWTFLFDASIADKCWMSSYPYHYKGCSKWTLLKDNDQECTEIVLGGHSTLLLDKRRTQRLKLPFLLTNQHKFPQHETLAPETPGGHTYGIDEYSTIDVLQKTGNQTFTNGSYISTTTQSLENHDIATTKDYTSEVDATSTSHSITVSSEFISTKAEDDLSVSVTEYEGSSTNALSNTVESISNGNGNRISTTNNQQSKSDSTATTDHHQLETTGNQEVTNEETSTTWYQTFESDAISTNTFQQSSSDKMSTTGYRQLKSTGHYEQTPVPVSTIFHGEDHTSTDHETSDISMSTLTTSFNVDANKSTTKQSTTPKVTPALTFENVFYNTTLSSAVQTSKSFLTSQETTTTQTTTLTDNFLSTIFESTISANCRSTIYKTEDNGAFQLFIETLGGIQTIQFQAKASKGIRVSLLMSLTMADFVEVKIGGNANDRSEIRSCSMGQCVLKREVTTQQHLTSEEFQEFWIEHIPRESLSVSRNNEDIPIMQWTGLPVLEFKYAAFSTDDYKSGEFRFCSQNGLDFQEIQSSALAPCPKVVNHLSCTCELPTLAAEANVCHCLDHSTDVTCLWLPNDCDQLWQNGVVENGIYTIYPTRNKDLPFHVYCNMTANEGWTVLQRRVDGSVNFNRNYGSYKKGFGTLNHEFWLGNEKIFHLTNQINYTLRIDMVLDGGVIAFAEYDAFRINDETDVFRLASLGSFTGSGFDAMALSLNMGFSTFDHDVDTTSYNCASISGGGWWYEGGNSGWCYHANLNGIYGDQRDQPAIIWYIGSGLQYEYLVKRVEMKIRPT